MFKCFANNQTLSLKGLMDADQYFSSLKGFFAEEEEEEKKKHISLSLKNWFSPSCVNDRFTCREKKPVKKKKKLNVEVLGSL